MEYKESDLSPPHTGISASFLPLTSDKLGRKLENISTNKLGNIFRRVTSKIFHYFARMLSIFSHFNEVVFTSNLKTLKLFNFCLSITSCVSSHEFQLESFFGLITRQSTESIKANTSLQSGPTDHVLTPRSLRTPRTGVSS